MIRALVVDVMGAKASVMLDDKEIIDIDVATDSCDIGDYIPVHTDMVSALDDDDSDDRPTFNWK